MKHSKMTITIRDDQKAWIKDHPEFNLSGLVQKCIDKIMEENRSTYRKEIENVNP